MLLVSLLTAPLGLTEPFFIPSYWSPPTLFNLAYKIHFDIESIIFSFAVGGITAVIYEAIFKVKRKKLPNHNQHQSRHRIHAIALASPIVSFLLLFLLTPLNVIYCAIIALIIGVIATWYCRPDLLQAMFTGGFLFLIVYFVIFFITFVLLTPGYIQAVWNFSNISGILILGVPVEELLFAGSLGAMWSSIYEHFKWYQYS
ncbi:hypothetical protein HYT02_05440 [Candidatus Gottesmanbacteria bacterium]|nr:hypothetical protein [Candidatus Gottesmanbacteria bacterium]